MDLSAISKEIKTAEEELKPEKEWQAKKLKLEKYSGDDRMRPFEDVLKEIGTDSSAGYFTRIPKLDSTLGGFRDKQLVVISGATGHGKTSFMQFLLSEFAQDSACAFFSYEIGYREFADKFNGNVPKFHVPNKKKNGKLEWLFERMEESIAKYDTKVFFIDHLHFLLDMKMLEMVRSTSLAIGNVMRELKGFAFNNDVVIFLAAHIKQRETEEAPTVDDLRDSSFIAQESDIVLLIWRERKKDRQSESGYIETGKTIIHVGKNRRTGQLGTVATMFDKGRYLEYDSYHTP